MFQCSKNYGSQTRVTTLKVVPNMADQISIEDSDSRLNACDFFQKPQNFVQFDFVQISLVACGTNIFLGMYGET